VIRPHILILGALGLLLLLTVPVAAVETLIFEDATLINVEAPNDLMITSIRCADIPVGGNISLNLNNYGQMYVLQVTSSKSWESWCDFDVTCTYPNGTSDSKHLSSLNPAAALGGGYDLTIQPYFMTADSIIDVDIAVGLLPLSAEFRDDISYNPLFGVEMEGQYTPVFAFSQVSGSLTHPGDITLYMTTQEEYQAQQENDLILKFQQAAKDIFSWSWEQLLMWIEKIPGVGPLFAAALEITALVISEVFWWFTIAIYQRNLLILLIEFWIIADAMLNTKSLMGMLKKIVNNHIKIARGLIWLTEVSVGLILKVIQAVANVVSALKPI